MILLLFNVQHFWINFSVKTVGIYKNAKLSFMIFLLYDTPALQSKLNEEKTARQRSESVCQEKDRQMSMLSVDYRQMQQRLQKLEGEHRQETEKVILLKLLYSSLRIQL